MQTHLVIGVSNLFLQETQRNDRCAFVKDDKTVPYTTLHVMWKSLDNLLRRVIQNKHLKYLCFSIKICIIMCRHYHYRHPTALLTSVVHTASKYF
jgi:hypothetical protein